MRRRRGKADTPPARTEFTIAWTIYAGWMPWPYAQQAGIVTEMGGAIRPHAQYRAGQRLRRIASTNSPPARSMRVTSTTMDALTIPAAGGDDTSVVIIGDYSNGNDGVVLKGAQHAGAIFKGRPVNLVELSVSHYLLARALEERRPGADRCEHHQHLGRRHRRLLWRAGDDRVGDLESAIVDRHGACRTHMKCSIPRLFRAKFSIRSSCAPKRCKSNPDLGKALAGIWYETMALMNAQTPEGAAARAAMGQLSGTDQAGFEAQLRTTAMYYEPGRCAGLLQQRGARDRHGSGAPVQLRARLVRPGRDVRGRDRHRLSQRGDAGQRRKREAALRSELYRTRGRRDS